MAKKAAQPEQTEEAPKPEPVYKYRYTENGAELGMRDDGHLVVFSYGAITHGVPVRPKDPLYRHRRGIVTGLIAGWGPPPVRVTAVVMFELPVTIKDPEVRNPKPPVRLWPADELEVIP